MGSKEYFCWPTTPALVWKGGFCLKQIFRRANISNRRRKCGQRNYKVIECMQLDVKKGWTGQHFYKFGVENNAPCKIIFLNKGPSAKLLCGCCIKRQHPWQRRSITTWLLPQIPLICDEYLTVVAVKEI